MMTVNRIHKLLDNLQSTPWESLFHPDLDSLFNWSPSFAPAGRPPRMWTGEKGVVIELDLPGHELDELDVSTEGNHLTIEVKESAGQPAEGAKYHLRERHRGADRATFRLPFALKEELTEVVYEKGVLRISVQKPEEEQVRKLTVRGA